MSPGPLPVRRMDRRSHLMVTATAGWLRASGTQGDPLAEARGRRQPLSAPPAPSISGRGRPAPAWGPAGGADEAANHPELERRRHGVFPAFLH